MEKSKDKQDMEIKKYFDPVEIFVNQNISVWFWFIIFCFLAIMLISQPYFLMELIGRRRTVVIMDGSDTFHVAVLKYYSESEELFKTHAKYVTKSLLTRGPGGPDYPELLDQMFSDYCLKNYVNPIFAASKRDFIDKKIYQKAIINDDIKVSLDESDGSYIAVVSGKLKRKGRKNDHVLHIDDINYTLKMKLVKNRQIIQNGRLPFVVHRMRLETTKKKKSKKS